MALSLTQPVVWNDFDRGEWMNANEGEAVQSRAQ